MSDGDAEFSGTARARLGGDGIVRCAWAGDDPLYAAYHDEEWGVPERDDRALWEKLSLDGFQAGLSWLTILRKRENFRRAFRGFDPERVAKFGERDVERLLGDVGIVRHRGKIEATIRGARAWLAVMEREGFADLVWDAVDGEPIVGGLRDGSPNPTADARSKRLSRRLRERGFSFCGPTIVYAFMEASGLLNNHLAECHRSASAASSESGVEDVSSDLRRRTTRPRP